MSQTPIRLAVTPAVRYHTAHPLEDGGKVKNSGAFLTLGAITRDPASDNAVTVRASIYRGVGDGTGNDYRLERSGTTWQITGVTQDWNDQP